jgi:hypothetical protein
MSPLPSVSVAAEKRHAFSIDGHDSRRNARSPLARQWSAWTITYKGVASALSHGYL